MEAMEAMDLASADHDNTSMSMSKDVSTSFDAVYEPAKRHVVHVVAFPSLKRATANHGSDGDLMRDVIKQQIAKQEENKVQLKRRQSRLTEFDAKNKTNHGLWGRKKNSFATKNGQQVIIEWRFVSSDNMAHTLVLQHEQIKKKKKSKRMVILDGNERYSDKSKKKEFKINVPECDDVLDVNIECHAVSAMKYDYRLKINDIAYSVVFHRWSKPKK
eukprot:UN13728